MPCGFAIVPEHRNYTVLLSVLWDAFEVGTKPHRKFTTGDRIEGRGYPIRV